MRRHHTLLILTPIIAISFQVTRGPAQEGQLVFLPEGVGADQIEVYEEKVIPQEKPRDIPPKVLTSISNSYKNIQDHKKEKSSDELAAAHQKQLVAQETNRIYSFVRERNKIDGFRKKYLGICRDPRARAAMPNSDFHEITAFLYGQSYRLENIITDLKPLGIDVEQVSDSVDARKDDVSYRSMVFNATPSSAKRQTVGETSAIDPLSLALQKAQTDIDWTREKLEKYYDDITGTGTYLLDPTVGAFCFDSLKEYKDSIRPLRLEYDKEGKPIRTGRHKFDIAECNDEQKKRLRTGFAFRVPWRFTAMAIGEYGVIRYTLVRPVISMGRGAIAFGKKLLGTGAAAAATSGATTAVGATAAAAATTTSGSVTTVAAAESAKFGTRVVTTVMHLNNNMLPTPCYSVYTLPICEKLLGLAAGTLNVIAATPGATLGAAKAVGSFALKMLPTSVAYSFFSNRIVPWFNYVMTNYWTPGQVKDAAYEQLGRYYELAVDSCYYRSCIESAAEAQAKNSPEMKEYFNNLQVDDSRKYCTNLPRILGLIRRSEFATFSNRLAELFRLKNTMIELSDRLREINRKQLNVWDYREPLSFIPKETR